MSTGGARESGSQGDALVSALVSEDWDCIRRELSALLKAPTGPVLSVSGAALVADLLGRLAPFAGSELPSGPLRLLRRVGLGEDMVAARLAGAALTELDWPWPHRRPFARLSDEEIIGWTQVLSHAPRIDLLTCDFLTSVLKLRKRQHWLPAARTIGRLAARDPLAREQAMELARRHLRRGLPIWSPGGKSGSTAHEVRHAVVAFAAWAAADPASAREEAGIEANSLLASIPKEEADCSALTQAAAELAHATDHVDAVMGFVRKLVGLEGKGGCRPEKQVAEALLALVGFLPETKESEATRCLQCFAGRPELDNFPVAHRFTAARILLGEELARRLGSEAWDEWLAEEPELRGCLLLASERWTHAPEVSHSLADERSRSFSFLALDPVRQAGERQQAWTAEVIERLVAMRAPQTWALLHPLRQAALVEEVLLLLGRQDVRSIPWQALTAAAGWPQDEENASYSLEGPTAEVAHIGLVLALARLKQNASHLAREEPVQTERAIELTARRHPFLDIQLALALEMELRVESEKEERGAKKKHSPAKGPQPEPGQTILCPGPLRLLYRLLQQRPSPNFWAQLDDLSRDPKLKEACRACGAFVGAESSTDDLERQYAKLLDALDGSLPQARQALDALRSLSRRVQDLAQRPLLPALRELSCLFGQAGTAEVPGAVSIRQLVMWCTPLADVNWIDPALGLVSRRADSIEACEDLHALDEALDGLGRDLESLATQMARRLPQPEEDLVAEMIGRLVLKVDRLRGSLRSFQETVAPGGPCSSRELARAMEAGGDLKDGLGDGVPRSLPGVVDDALESLADRVLSDLLERGEEETVLKLLGDSSLDTLQKHASEQQLDRLQAWLYNRCLIGAARKLREQRVAFRTADMGVTSTPRLPASGGGFWSHFSPLLVGVCFGTTQVMGVGIIWNDLVKSGHLLVAICLGVAALVGTYAYMMLHLLDWKVRLAAVPSGFNPGSTIPEGGNRLLAWLIRVRRVAPLFGLNFFISLVTSSFVLVLARDHQGIGKVQEAAMQVGLPPLALMGTQLFLWTSMTLFLGVFLGFIAQGRKLGE